MLLAASSLLLAAHTLASADAPDWSFYHTTDEIFAELESLAKSCPVLKVWRQKAASGSYAVNTQLGLFSDAASAGKKARLHVTFGEHGRELISSEVALQLARVVCTPGSPEAAAAAKRFGYTSAWVAELLRHLELQFVPVENLVTRRKVEKGDLCNRMNGRGVDINRNWDNHWGIKGPEYLASEEYGGTKAFSEPETRISRDAIAAFKPLGFVSIHAGIREMYMPYDHISRQATDPALHEVMALINKKHCRCKTGSAGQISGYHAYGTATDYMYEILKIPLTFTWEIAGDPDAPMKECFKAFNPVTKAEYDESVQNWAGAILTFGGEIVRRSLDITVTGKQPAAGGAAGAPAVVAAAPVAASAAAVTAAAAATAGLRGVGAAPPPIAAAGGAAVVMPRSITSTAQSRSSAAWAIEAKLGKQLAEQPRSTSVGVVLGGVVGVFVALRAGRALCRAAS